MFLTEIKPTTSNKCFHVGWSGLKKTTTPKQNAAEDVKETRVLLILCYIPFSSQVIYVQVFFPSFIVP